MAPLQGAGIRELSELGELARAEALRRYALLRPHSEL